MDLVLNAEMIRDGGSLAVSFKCADGSDYTLFFKLDYFVNENGEHERRGYLPPVVMHRLYGTEISVSWPHAEILLGQMLGMARSKGHRKWIETMIEVVGSRGGLPSSIGRHYCGNR